MTTPSADDLDKLTQEAKILIADSESHLDTLFNSSKNMGFADVPLEEQVNMLQLLLQYRLDAQNILNRLMGLERSLLAALGVGPQHSGKINLERLSFAIGGEDIKQLLFALTELISLLQKIIERQRKHQKEEDDEKNRKKALKASEKYREAKKALEKATQKQKEFGTVLDKMHNVLKHMLKHEAKGQLLNHIGALQGPISRFHQAIQSGLASGNQLSRTLSKQANIPLSVNAIVQKIDKLNLVIETKAHTRSMFSHEKSKGQDLDQQAQDKRMKNFFNNT